MTPVRSIGKTLLFNALRFGFRLAPMSEARRDRLRQKFLDYFSHLVPPAPRGQYNASALHRGRVRSAEPVIGHVAYRQEALPSPLPATLVTFYLPQFHPIPENDAWWGKGFTEWRNVARALPQFEGHQQPRLPADLGFYDLRNADTLQEQVRLASEYGIGAFCFYFYWFGGKTLLESPIEQWLRDDSIDFPVCLCWANENWTRRWDGRGGDVLISQAHSPQDDLAFIAHISRYLRDPRYLRVDRRPLVLVYRPGLLPDAKATATRWREWSRANGIGEIMIAYVQGFERPDPRDLGFDAAVEFPPNLCTPADITARQRLINPEYAGQVLDWREIALEYQQRSKPPYRLFPGVNCGWDNEPRRPGRGRTYLHASPRHYRGWLHHTITSRLATVPSTDRLVFINAWNEWAEGAMLEPDESLGHAWLQATRSALKLAASPTEQPQRSADRLCAVIHAWYPDGFDEILAALEACGVPLRLIVTTSPDKVEQIQGVLDSRSMVAEMNVFQNRGRDILPFLRVSDRLIDEGEDVVLKLHTKRSPHREDGDRWRVELLGGLLSRAHAVMQAFGRDQSLGMVAPDGHIQPLSYYWGANEENVSRLATRVGIATPPVESDFFVPGSMFWIRLHALRPLLDARLGDWEFEAEDGQLDGTTAHAVERTFALSARHQGLTVASSSDVCGEKRLATSAPYPFASRH